MGNHVFARLSGHNLTILPLAPFRYHQQSDDGRRLVLSHTPASTIKQAILVVENGAYRVELAANTASFDEVADVTPSAQQGEWRIETSLFSLVWPHQFDFVSAADAAGPSVFDLIGPDNALIYVQGPFATTRLPSLEEMAAPGQHISARGSSTARPWVELAYDHEGISWIQRHYVIRFDHDRSLVVTMQAPQQQAESSIAATEAIAQTLEPFKASD